MKDERSADKTHLERIKDLSNPFGKSNFANNLGIKINDISLGYAEVEMKVKDDMLNRHGTAHGGTIFTLADAAFGLAGNTRGPAVALQISINYLKPVFPGQVLKAIAKEEGLTRSTGIYNVIVENEKGESVALFRGTIFRKDKIINEEQGELST